MRLGSDLTDKWEEMAWIRKAGTPDLLQNTNWDWGPSGDTLLKTTDKKGEKEKKEKEQKGKIVDKAREKAETGCLLSQSHDS